MRHLGLLCLCTVVGCATAAPTASTPTAPALAHPSPPQAAELVLAETDSPVRFCVGSAIRTQFALTAMKKGHATPQRVHDALVGSLKDPALVAQRERQYAEWTKAEDPASVALVALDGCLPWRGVAFDFAREADACFRTASTIGTSVLVAKKTGVKLAVAKQRFRAAFQGSAVPEKALLTIVDGVYATPDGDPEFRALEMLFGGCLKGMSGAPRT